MANNLKPKSEVELDGWVVTLADQQGGPMGHVQGFDQKALSYALMLPCRENTYTKDVHEVVLNSG